MAGDVVTSSTKESNDVAVYIFNKRIKHMFRMLGVDSPNHPTISLLKAAFKTIKAIDKAYVRTVFLRDVVPTYGDSIRVKEPFFSDPKFAESMPLLAWVLPSLCSIYKDLLPTRQKDYWKEFQGLR
jgi:hypothetical protein